MSDGDRARERERETDRQTEKRLLEKRVTGGERERESVTHAAFPLGTIPYPDTHQAISQHPFDVMRSRDCSRSVLSLFGSVRFYYFFSPRRNLVTNFTTASR